MKRLLANRPLSIVLRVFLAIVFIVAAASKINAPGVLAKGIYEYEMLHPRVINLMAIYLPWVELAAGVALLFGRVRRGAAFLVCAMLVMFLVALSFNWMLGNDIECGCFGAHEPIGIPIVGTLVDFFFTSSDMVVTIWRDVVLLAMGAFVLFSPVGWRPAANR